MNTKTTLVMIALLACGCGTEESVRYIKVGNPTAPPSGGGDSVAGMGGSAPDGGEGGTPTSMGGMGGTTVDGGNGGEGGQGGNQGGMGGTATTTLGTEQNPAHSCKQIFEASASSPSGRYWIRADPACASEETHCDMDTHGGGWTVIADLVGNFNSVDIPYTHGCSSVRAGAQEVMLAHRDITLAVIGTEWAVMAMPPTWVVQSPFSYESEALPVLISVAGLPPVGAILVHGYKSFGGGCDLAWNTNDYGRLCTPGVSTPAFFGFASTLTDTCGVSTSDIGDMPLCSDHRRFTLSVR